MTPDQNLPQPDVKTIWAKILDKATPILIGLLISAGGLATAWINSKIEQIKHGQEKATEKIETVERKQDATAEVVTKTEKKAEALTVNALGSDVNKAANAEAKETAQAIQETK